VGLQGIYLRLKSVQRFTEAWALFERAASQRGFRHEQLLGQETVRVVSIGGGPGFELLAFDLFFRFLRQSAHARAHAERAAKAKAEAAAATAAAAPPAAGPGKAAGGGVGGGSSWADVMEDEDEGTATQQLPRLRLPAGGSKARPPLTAYPWLRAHMPAPGLDDAPTAAAGAGAGEPGAGEPCACALECISLDLQPGWAPYLDGLGEASAGLRAGNVASTYRFVQADLASLLQGGGLRAHVSRALAEAGAARRVDYCIISNVLIYCSDEPTVPRARARTPGRHAREGGREGAGEPGSSADEPERARPRTPPSAEAHRPFLLPTAVSFCPPPFHLAPPAARPTCSRPCCSRRT
jgi:hypothetical protein